MISRALVAILLMMNVGIAAWWLLRDAPLAADASTQSQDGVPPLVLLAERPVPAPDSAKPIAPAPAPPAEQSAPAETTSATASPAPAQIADSAPPRDAAALATEPANAPEVAATTGTDAAIACFSIGPFQSLADLRRVSAAIEPALQRQQMREARGTETRGYRVYLPAFATRQLALETARALEARGLRDYYVVTAGAGENTVSLGLFRELANAEARREEVRGFGYEARLEPRTEDITRWWLDIAARADSGWRERTGNFPGTRIDPMVCQ